MTTAHLSPAAARRVFYSLTLTRWFPIGLVVGVMTLLPLERGLTVAESLAALAFSGWVVFALELPTSGFADAFGRKPVYVVAAAVQIAAASVLLVAHSFWTFALGSVLMGVFRALDSGPLEAWFVDTVHETEPGADVDKPLSAQGTILGVGIAAGALLSGALVWWHPFRGASALVLPFALYAVLTVVHLGAVLALLREPRTHVDSSGVSRALQSAKEAPVVVRDGLSLLRRNRILRGLVAVEVFWSIAMVVFETFQPIRLGELLGSEDRAGAWMGPTASAGWAIFAAGSALAGVTSTRVGVAGTAVIARVLNSLGAVVMGLVAGPVALVAAYLFTYSMHGMGGPMHGALLHREAKAGNRATVLSMNSMMMFAAYSVAAPLLGVLSDATSTQLAMVTAGTVSLLGVVCYLPALRHERRSRPSVEDTELSSV
jgi:MFS family permease